MTRSRSGRSAVLIDLENLLWDEDRVIPREPVTLALPQDHLILDDLPYPWVDDARATTLIALARSEAAAALGGAPDYTMAAAVSHLMRRAAFLPGMEQVCPRVVPSEPDAADRYLIDIAEHLAEVGFTRFVIVSGDHAFADFAARHKTAVVVRSRKSLSHELRLAADRVRLIVQPLVA